MTTVITAYGKAYSAFKNCSVKANVKEPSENVVTISELADHGKDFQERKHYYMGSYHYRLGPQTVFQEPNGFNTFTVLILTTA